MCFKQVSFWKLGSFCMNRDRSLVPRDPLGEVGEEALRVKLGSFCIQKRMGGWVNGLMREEIFDFLFSIVDLCVSIHSTSLRAGL